MKNRATGGNTNTLDRIRAEWPLLCADRSAFSTVTGWLTGAGVLAPGRLPRDLNGVLAKLERGDAALGREHTDQWMGAVLRHVGSGGRDGQLAARFVVQAMLPGATATVYRMRRFGHGLDDVVHVVVTALCEVVLSYPLERRPQKIAANLLMDMVNRAHHELRRGAYESASAAPAGISRRAPLVPEEIGPEELAARRVLVAAAAASGVPGLADVDDRDLAGPRGQVVELLMWALSRRVLERGEVAVISDYYRQDAPSDRLAAQRAGIPLAALRKRRSRAVRRLAAAANQWLDEVA